MRNMNEAVTHWANGHTAEQDGRIGTLRDRNPVFAFVPRTHCRHDLRTPGALTTRRAEDSAEAPHLQRSRFRLEGKSEAGRILHQFGAHGHCDHMQMHPSG